MRGNLEKASKLRDEAENIKIAYDKSLRQADKHAKDFLDNMVEDIHARQAQRIEEAHMEASSNIQMAENHLQEQKEALLKDADTIVSDLTADILQKINSATADTTAPKKKVVS